MTRDFLTQLGLSDDQVDKIMAQHGKDVQNTEANNKELQAKNEALQKQVDETSSQIKKLGDDAKNAADYKDQIEKLQDEMKQSQSKYKQELETQRLNFAIDNGLRDSGAKNVKATKALLDASAIKFDDKGQLIGLSDQIKSLKEDKNSSFLFNSEPDDSKDDQKPKNNHVQAFPTGNPTPANDSKPLNKMTVTDLARLKADDPDRFKQITADYRKN